MTDRLTSTKDRLTDTGFGAAWSLVKTLPEPVADRIFRAAADAAFRRRGPSVVQLARNLHRVLGEKSTPEALSAVVQAGMRSYARYWKETFRLQGMAHDEVYAQVEATVIGKEHIQRAVDEGRGIVLPITHSGNWDVAGLWVARTWGSMTTVAERLKPEPLYEKFVAYRESLGMEILPLTPLPGGRSTSALLRERLTAGAIVPLVADRDLSASGVPVTFFGEATKVPAGPAMLAALTDSYLCPTNLSFTEGADGTGGWSIDIQPPMTLPGTRLSQQVRGGAQQIVEVFERFISAHPADWHMLQPLWLADLPRPAARSRTP